MKKYAALFLALCLLLSLAACGGDRGTQTPDDSSVQSGGAQTDTPAQPDEPAQPETEAPQWELQPIAGELTENHMLAMEVANRFLDESGRDFLDAYLEKFGEVKPVYINEAAIYEFPEGGGYPVRCLLMNIAGGFCFNGHFNDWITVLYDMGSGELYDMSLVPLEEMGYDGGAGDPIKTCLNQYYSFYGNDTAPAVAEAVPAEILVQRGEAIADWKFEPLGGEAQPQHQLVLEAAELFLAERGEEYLNNCVTLAGERYPLSISDAAEYHFPEKSGLPANCLLMNIKGGFVYGEDNDAFADSLVVFYDMDSGRIFDMTMLPADYSGSTDSPEDAVYYCMNVYDNINFGGDMFFCEGQEETVLVKDGNAVAVEAE